MHRFTEDTLKKFKQIILFTGAGMSAESGVPTYRGSGGIWHQYKWQEFACQEAFEKTPEEVLKFHEIRRRKIKDCHPHAGHYAIVELESKFPDISIITQNIDGMHQKAGSQNIFELHGSLWRVRCDNCKIQKFDYEPNYQSKVCEICGNWIRPDIVWFGDSLNFDVIGKVNERISTCDLFISIGTSGVVFPAAEFIYKVSNSDALCIEINPEPTELSHLFDDCIRGKASVSLPELFQF